MGFFSHTQRIPDLHPLRRTGMSIVLADGLTKKIIKEGTGAQPKAGQRVWAHYTGKLTNGEVFDSSRGKPHRVNGLDFVIDAGQVIRGWDIGIASMKVGEVAELTC